MKSADGLSLYVRDYAPVAPETGLPVFCLHGLTRNAADFELVAPRIAALGRRTLAWDTRGRGRSDRDPEPARYNGAIYAQDVIRVLDELGVERCVFLGTSMGALITMILTTLAPQRIAAAILNDLGPVIDPSGLARIAGYVGKTGAVSSWEGAAAAVRAVNGDAFPDADDAFWTRFARRTFRETDRGVLEPDYDPAIANALAAPGEGAPAPDLSPLFKALAAAPILVIRGATSDILSAEGVAAMRALKSDVVVVEVPRIGHAPTLEEPEAFDAIVDFLAAVP
ncbi:MAG: alpha/beta fold hydrolase [Alphaproteobacteria bacterium]|nr:alpha/beta fold hydrolase [Alphaproteobacteria bacterium]